MVVKLPKKGSYNSFYLISLVPTFIGGLYLYRDLFRGTPYESDVTCEGKVAIVTGGSSGIGKETARELAKRGATVFLLCRDKERCQKARKEIVITTKNKYVYARECDLGCLDSVRKFAEQFNKEESRLDILINNAGIWRMSYEKTKDGFETQLGVNHMGHFLLTNLLLDLLIKSSPSRIINVTASTYHHGFINKKDLNSEKRFSGIEAYNQSKLANLLFTTELSQRLKGTGVTANAVNPGPTLTGLYSYSSTAVQKIANVILKPFLWVIFRTPESGAQTTLYAALDPSLENVTGKYFSDCEEREIKPGAVDDSTAKWLWAVSEKWTKLVKNDEGNVEFS